MTELWYCSRAYISVFSLLKRVLRLSLFLKAIQTTSLLNFIAIWNIILMKMQSISWYLVYICICIYYIIWYIIDDKANQQKEKKSLKSRQKNHRPSCSHNQESHKSTKLKAMIYTQRVWCTPRRPYACGYSLWEFTWALLGWVRGHCSLGVLCPSGHNTPYASSCTGFPEFWGPRLPLNERRDWQGEVDTVSDTCCCIYSQWKNPPAKTWTNCK